MNDRPLTVKEARRMFEAIDNAAANRAWRESEAQKEPVMNTETTDSLAPVAHTPGPWQRKSIPGHLFEINNGQGEIVLRIRGGMMPTLADARLLAEAPALLALVKQFVRTPEASAVLARIEGVNQS